MPFLKICLLAFLFADGLEVLPEVQTETLQEKQYVKVKRTKAKNAAEVNSEGHFTHHKLNADQTRWKASKSPTKVQEVHKLPVTFFQEDLQQEAFHKTHETRVVKESGEAPVERREPVKLSDKDGDAQELADPEDSDEDAEASQSEAVDVKDTDDFTLPPGDRTKEELQGHSDNAAVAALSTSIMRREVDKAVKHELAETVVKLWFGVDIQNGKVQHRWRKAVLVLFFLLGLALIFMLLAVVKADNVIKRVLPVGRATEPTGSELQEPSERKEAPRKELCSEGSKDLSLASLVESSLGQCAVRKPNKNDKDQKKDSDLDTVQGALRSRIQALPVSAASQVEKMLPSTGGYDVNFSKPMSSRWLLRLEAVVQEPQGESLLSPLTQRPCVLYTAHASRRVHGGMPLPVAFASQHVDFTVTLCGFPRVEIRVAGSEVNLFSTTECEFAEVLPFPCAPDHWQDFVSVHLSGAGTGSCDNHALENELRDKGTAVEFHECCLATGATVTLVGELLRSANGELTLQPLSQEQVSWKRTSWERAGLAEADDLELLEARTHVLISDDPTLLGR